MASTIESHTRSLKGNPTIMRNVAGTYDYGTLAVLPDSDTTPNALLWRHNVATGAVDTFDLSTIPGNPIGLPLGGDGHWVLSVAVAYSNTSDDHDVLHIMGNGHNQPFHYGYVDVNTWPPTGWTFPVYSSMPWSQLGLVEMHTYHIWHRTPDGTIILVAEQEPTSTAFVEGRVMHAWYMLPHTKTFLPLLGTGKEIIIRAEMSAPTGVPDRVYPQGLAVDIRPDQSLRLWLWGIWRRLDEATSLWWANSPFCMYHDLAELGTGTMHACDGTALPVPFRWADKTMAEITSAPANSPDCCATVAVDTLGNPHMTLLKAQGTGGPDWKHCWWDGTAWQGAYLSGPDQGPGIVAFRNDIYTETENNRRLRLAAMNTPWTGGTVSTRYLQVGGATPFGSAPVPEPTGCWDRSRLTFSIPDGNMPAVYDVGTRTIPTI